MVKFEQVLSGVPDIKVLKTPFGDSWSGVTLIGGKGVKGKGDKSGSGGTMFLIDSGANTEVVDSCLVPALKEEGISLDSVSWLLNTHTHGDHIGGHYRIKELAPAIRIAAYRGSLDKMRDPLKYNKLVRARFPEHSNPPALALKGTEPDVLVDDDGLIGGRMRLIYAPGHDNDTVCWYDEYTGTMITGDAIQANGTPPQGISFYMYLPEYRSTLSRLMKMAGRNLITGHKYVPIEASYEGADKVMGCLKLCQEIVERNSGLITEAMALTADRKDVAAVTVKALQLLGAKKPDFLFLAMYTVAAHMKEIMESTGFSGTG